MTDNNSNVLIKNGYFISETPIRSWQNGKITINNGQFNGTGDGIVVTNDVELEINGGSFICGNSAISSWGDSNVKINRGEFNSSRTDYNWDGIIQNGGNGTTIIGNIGDNNDNILINNNNNLEIGGVYKSDATGTIIINSGTISGYCGVNLDKSVDDVVLYLNGGIISGINSGWSINSQNSTHKIYKKRNSNLLLSGNGYTGINSMRITSNIIDID